MGTIGERIKAERVRLKFSQEAFGDFAGVGKHSQIRYEKGERSPDGDYFSSIHALGADVLYIITGHRAPFVAQEHMPYLTPARNLAGDIAEMKLSQEDADTLLALAVRLENK